VPDRAAREAKRVEDRQVVIVEWPEQGRAAQLLCTTSCAFEAPSLSRATGEGSANEKVGTAGSVTTGDN